MKFTVAGKYTVQVGSSNKKNGPNRTSTKPKSRKELRKEKRLEAKKKKKENAQRWRDYMNGRSNPKSETTTLNTAEVVEPEEEKDKHTVELKTSKKKQRSSVLNLVEREREEDKKKLEKLKQQMEQTRRKQFVEASGNDDREIRKLEKLLGIKKKKNKTETKLPKSLVMDGLDYLLDVCDPEKLKAMKEENIWENSSSEDEDDEEPKEVCTKKRQNNQTELLDMDSDQDDNDQFDGSDIDMSQDDLCEEEDDEEVEVGEEEGDEEVEVGEEEGDEEVEVGEEDDEEVEMSEEEDMHDEEMADEEDNGDGTMDCTSDEEDNKDDDSENEDISEDVDGTEFEKNDSKETSSASKSKKRVRFADEEQQEEKGNEKAGQWEDIYGRLRDKSGSVIENKSGAYIPPAKRAAMSCSNDPKKSEELNKVKRLLRGLLNRLSESSMHKIAMQIEQLYQQHSQNTMNDSVTNLILDLASQTGAQEKFMTDYAFLLAILHANIGTGVGAFFLQTVAERFDKGCSDETQINSKSIDNLIFLLCHVYYFGVVNSKLIFDILKKLGEKFGEKELDLILLILKTVGIFLRKDEPSTLKECVMELQEKARAVVSEGMSRITFMFEVLNAIKNNNMSKIPNCDTSYVQHLKKTMKQYLHAGSYVTELKISLEDLLKANERGRWWVVGSAWTGMLPGESADSESGVSSTKGSAKTPAISPELLELARQQRMNTDVRRNIFFIIIQAEDYLDAFQKLLKLGLKNQQEREIIYIIVDLCLQERTYNKYYAVLAERFCTADRKHQLTFQYAAWDRIKRLDKLTSFQFHNLASLLSYLFIQQALPITALKVIEFPEMTKVMCKFLKKILLSVLLEDTDDGCRKTFARIANSQKINAFREGLKLFMHHFLLRKKEKTENPELLERRVRLAERSMSVNDSRLRF